MPVFKFFSSHFQIISKKLVTFRDIEDLQANNQKLLVLIRELSSKHEEMETSRQDVDVSALQEQEKCLKSELAALRENLNHQSAMLEQLKQQRDLYKDMYQKVLRGESVQQVLTYFPLIFNCFLHTENLITVSYSDSTSETW